MIENINKEGEKEARSTAVAGFHNNSFPGLISGEPWIKIIDKYPIL